MAKMKSQYFSIEEGAALKGVGKAQVYKWAHDRHKNGCPAIKITKKLWKLKREYEFWNPETGEIEMPTPGAMQP